MKTYTRKNLITKLIISVVAAVVTLIVMFATGLWNFEGESMLYLIVMIPAFLVVLPFSYYSGFFVNWKKAFSKMLFPIPLISYLIECCKGFVPAAKSIVAIIKKQETFTYGKNDGE